jgi:hypothetical protein
MLRRAVENLGWYRRKGSCLGVERELSSYKPSQLLISEPLEVHLNSMLGGKFLWES